MAGRYLILSLPERPLQAIELAGRTCYRSENKIMDESAAGFVRMLMRRGHDAMIEFGGWMAVRFSGISRGFTHEQVRHRLCSYAQESTRYVSYRGGLDFVPPPDLDMNAAIARYEDLPLTGNRMVELMGRFYAGLLDRGLKPQDARQFLPIGIRSEIVVGTNLRQWRHIFALRTNQRAHWEIREVMCKLLVDVQSRVPVVFDDFQVRYGVDGSPYALRQKPEEAWGGEATP